MILTTIWQRLKKQWLLLNPWAIHTAWIALLIGAPVFTLLYYLTTPPGDTWQHLQETVLWDYIQNSFLLMLGVGLLVFLMGTTTAWLVSTCNFPGQKIFEWANMLPLAMPTYIVAYTYSGMLDYTGPLQSFIRNTLEWQIAPGIFDILHLKGLVVVMSLVLYPYVFLIARTAFLYQSSAILEASRTLGSSASRTFFKVALPVARPAIVAGVSLALMEVLNDYGAVKFYGVSTFTTGIFRAWFSLGDIQAAIYLSCLLMLFILALILLERYQRGRARFSSDSRGHSAFRGYNLQGFKKWLVFLVCLLPVAFGFLLPAMQLVAWSFATFQQVIDNSFWQVVLNSFSLAAMAAIVCVFTATLLIYSVRLNPQVVVKGLARLSTLGYAIPGAVIAVGIMVPALGLDKALSAWLKASFGIQQGLLLSGTLTILVFAYLVRYLAVAYSPIEAGFQKINISLDQAARALQATPFKILRTVNLPLVKRALLGGGLLVFVDVLKELPLTLILRPFNFDTLATKAYEMASDELLAQSANASLIIVATGILPIIVLSKLISAKR